MSQDSEVEEEEEEEEVINRWYEKTYRLTPGNTREPNPLQVARKW